MFELSLAQKEIYKREIFYSNTSMNNNTIEITINKKISYELIDSCINDAVRNFSSLRLQIHKLDDESTMQDHVEFSEENFPLVKLSTYDKYLVWADQKAAECIFDHDSKLYRFYVVYIEDRDSWVVYFTIHHIIADALACSIVAKYIVNMMEKNFGNEYEDVEDYDYCRWLESEKKYLASKSYERDTEYWEQALTDYDDDEFKVRSGELNFRGKRLSKLITKEESDKIDSLCERYSVTIPNLFYSLFAIYRSKYNRAKCTSISLALHNRGAREKMAIGMFVSVLPLVINVDDEISMDEFVKYVKASETKMLKHHRYTYGGLHEMYPEYKGLLDFSVSYLTFDVAEADEKGYHLHWVYNRDMDEFSLSLSKRYAMDKYLFEYDYPFMKFTDEDVENISSERTSLAAPGYLKLTFLNSIDDISLY